MCRYRSFIREVERGELTKMEGGSLVIGAGRIFFPIESTKMNSAAIDLDLGSPPAGLPVEPDPLESAAMPPDVARIVLGSTDAQIRPSIVETIPVDVIDFHVGGWGHNQPVHGHDFALATVALSVSIYGFRPYKSFDLGEVNLIDKGTLAMGKWNNPASIFGRINRTVSGLSGFASMVARDIPKMLSSYVSIRGRGLWGDVSCLTATAHAKARWIGWNWGNLGAHMNLLCSCVMPRDAPTSPGLSVFPIIPKFAPLWAYRNWQCRKRGERG